jgi:hypothetical protein
MTFYARIENNAVAEYPIEAGALMRRFPSTSFPDGNLSPPDGYVGVVDVDPPEYDYTKNIMQGSPEFIDGVWKMTWVVTDATQNEIAERVAGVSSTVRRRRNDLLTVCDWTQVADAPVDKAAWAAYRQALRDITSQAGFPWTVTWPDAP